MSCSNVCNAFVLVLLLAACIALFVLHSLYFILKYTDDSSKEEFKKVTETTLSMPALVICNRMPFSQDGMNSVSQQIRQDASIRYLREWTNPSMRESADYFPAPSSYMQQGGNILLQYISPLNRNESIQRMQYQCQSVISSCSYQNVQLSSYDCCRNMVELVPTTRGLCWLWQDRSMTQNSATVSKQLHILFQISRNSWFSSTYLPSHPGVDVYLRENGDDVMRIVNELDVPLRLTDKRGVRLRMHKERRAMTRRIECGQAIGDSERSDRNNLEGNSSNILMCTIMASVRYCGCHPLLAEMIPYDVNKYRDFSLMVNSTNVCPVEQYDNCTRRYMDFTSPSNWEDTVPRDIAGWEQIENCRSDNHRSCLFTAYPGSIDQYDLPAEYQNTQDFVSRLTLEYDTMKVTEVLDSKDPNLYELLSCIGYNLALWFAVGHILWSLYANAMTAMCGQKNNKISPGSSSPSSSHQRFLSHPSPPPPQTEPSPGPSKPAEIDNEEP